MPRFLWPTLYNTRKSNLKPACLTHNSQSLFTFSTWENINRIRWSNLYTNRSVAAVVVIVAAHSGHSLGQKNLKAYRRPSSTYQDPFPQYLSPPIKQSELEKIMRLVVLSMRLSFRVSVCVYDDYASTAQAAMPAVT